MGLYKTQDIQQQTPVACPHPGNRYRVFFRYSKGFTNGAIYTISHIDSDRITLQGYNYNFKPNELTFYNI